MDEQKHEYKFIRSKRDFDDFWVDNARYKSWQKKDENKKLISLTFGFKKVMGNRRGYWLYDIPNDFDIIPLDSVLIESVEPLTNFLRRHLIKKYGEAYAEALKLHVHETQPEKYNEYCELIDKWLEEAKTAKRAEGENE